MSDFIDRLVIVADAELSAIGLTVDRAILEPIVRKLVSAGREPTESMLGARYGNERTGPVCSEPLYAEDAKTCWQAMTDEALK